MKMDHVIQSLKNWLDIYQDRPAEDRDMKAEKAIQAAIEAIYNTYYFK